MPSTVEARLNKLEGLTRSLLSRIGQATAFGQITVSGQDDVVADVPHDILTITAVSPIALTTSAAIKKLNFSLDTTLGSGTYTPTITNTSGVTGITAYPAQYMQVGNIVTVSSKTDLTVGALGSVSKVRISLPVTSNFGNDYECAGTANERTNPIVGIIIADTTNDQAELSFTKPAAGTYTLWYHFTYQVI